MPMSPEQMSEEELLDRARRAMIRAAKLPPKSPGRSIQWAVYDSYAGELRRRAARLGFGTGNAGASR